LFELDVAMQTTNTGEVFTLKALLDCGATDLFAHSNFIKRNWLVTRTLSCSIPVYNVDGTPNEAGSISEVWEAILQYQDHSECATFVVTSLSKQDIILGLAWLHKHNSEVNWQTNEVKMSYCPNHC
jgi:predicted aspartyl protease